MEFLALGQSPEDPKSIDNYLNFNLSSDSRDIWESTVYPSFLFKQFLIILLKWVCFLHSCIFCSLLSVCLLDRRQRFAFSLLRNSYPSVYTLSFIRLCVLRLMSFSSKQFPFSTTMMFCRSLLLELALKCSVSSRWWTCLCVSNFHSK